jgi:hypothetical protein
VACDSGSSPRGVVGKGECRVGADKPGPISTGEAQTSDDQKRAAAVPPEVRPVERRVVEGDALARDGCVNNVAESAPPFVGQLVIAWSAHDVWVHQAPCRPLRLKIDGKPVRFVGPPGGLRNIHGE